MNCTMIGGTYNQKKKIIVLNSYATGGFRG